MRRCGERSWRSSSTSGFRSAGGLDGWIRQDQLSLGEAQRLNLARAWLSERPIVLLDEPTEHLDEDQGRRILGRLLDHLQTRVVVIASHHSASLPLANVIRLTAPAVMIEPRFRNGARRSAIAVFTLGDLAYCSYAGIMKMAHNVMP